MSVALETGMRSDEARGTKESLHEKNQRSGADAPRFRLGSARDRTGARDRHATLHDYLRRWEASGLNWPPEASTSAADLERKLFAGLKPSKQPGRPLPDFTRVQAELRANKHVSLQLLWEEYRDANPSASF